MRLRSATADLRRRPGILLPVVVMDSGFARFHSRPGMTKNAWEEPRPSRFFYWDGGKFPRNSGGSQQFPSLDSVQASDIKLTRWSQGIGASHDQSQLLHLRHRDRPLRHRVGCAGHQWRAAADGGGGQDPYPHPPEPWGYWGGAAAAGGAR